MKKILSTDSAIIGGIGIAALLALSAVSGAGFGKTLSVLIGGIVAIWAYAKLLRPTATQSQPKSNADIMSDIRAKTLEDMAEALPRAVVVLNRAADIIYANEAALKMLSPNMIGQPIGAYLR